MTDWLQLLKLTLEVVIQMGWENTVYWQLYCTLTVGAQKTLLPSRLTQLNCMKHQKQKPKMNWAVHETKTPSRGQKTGFKFFETFSPLKCQIAMNNASKESFSSQFWITNKLIISDMPPLKHHIGSMLAFSLAQFIIGTSWVIHRKYTARIVQEFAFQSKIQFM